MMPGVSRVLLCGVALLAAQTALWYTPVRGQAPDDRQVAPVRAVELSVEPAQVTLTHGEDRQRLLVTGKLADGSVRDLTRKARFTSSNPAVADVGPDGTIQPRGPGQAVIQIVAGEAKASAAVTIATSASRPVSFAHDIMPLLARAGCNSGACHGAASGKKGFKISLRGYDPPTDYITLTRGTTGRRLNFIEPERSLLLIKPTAGVPHEGGQRFAADSPYARTLKRWIAEGGKSDLDKAPTLAALEVTPAFRSFSSPNQEQQLLVTARFSDGSRRDVTADARFSSSNEMVAPVSDVGLVELARKGETAVMVRYGARMAVANFVVLEHDPSFVWPNPPQNNYIDKLVQDKLKKMEIAPSELTTDSEFIRRVYYDVIGLPPAPAEVRAFLADARPDKRSRLIDALLQRPEHAEFWALKWGDLFKIRFETLRDQGTWGLYRWLRDSIAANKPYNQFVREIITAQGSCAENPPANFYRAFTDANEASEATAQVFFGIRLLCAKCHDHPFEKWVQTDYYGMAAFFSQVGRKPGRRREDLVVFHNEGTAQAQHSTTMAMVQPKLLDAAFAPAGPEQDARSRLAEWMTAKDNPFLARAAVNRFWSHLFGRGIIDPVDDIRSSNPPSNGPLLDALSKDFIDHNFDVRHILRTMLNSRTYQLSARTNKSNASDPVNFSHALPRRLSAEQVLDTLSQVTGIREGFRSRFGEGTVALPAGGVRAGQLPDRQLTAELLDIFGRPRGESSCACERHEEVSMTLALHLINGQSVARRLADANGNLARLVAKPKIADAQIIEELYLTVLCRLPTAAEQTTFARHFQRTPNKLQAAQDVLWVLFNTREFLFNH
jgi:hypothetical protein